MAPHSPYARRPPVACHRAPPRSWTLLVALAGFLRQLLGAGRLGGGSEGAVEAPFDDLRRAGADEAADGLDRGLGLVEHWEEPVPDVDHAVPLLERRVDAGRLRPL